jgi:predicted nuclease of predicted toxin-antitoxin system
MRLLANENFPLVAVTALRDAGHDVLWARTDMPGDTDTQILQRAQAEERLVITFDKDFGELAFRFGLPATCGVLLFRFTLRSPDYVRKRVVHAIESRENWGGCFAVIEEDRIRVRPLPPT